MLGQVWGLDHTRQCSEEVVGEGHESLFPAGRLEVVEAEKAEERRVADWGVVPLPLAVLQPWKRGRVETVVGRVPLRHEAEKAKTENVAACLGGPLPLELLQLLMTGSAETMPEVMGPLHEKPVGSTEADWVVDLPPWATQESVVMKQPGAVP